MNLSFYCKYLNQDFILGNYYGHASGSDIESRNTFLRFGAAFLPVLYSLTNPMISLVGDFNLILSKNDHSNLNHKIKPKAESALYDLLVQTQRFDMVNPNNVDKTQYTFHQPQPLCVQARLLIRKTGLLIHK